METLFSSNVATGQPLAEQLRPQQLADFIGQHQLVGEQGTIRRLIDNNAMVSMIFWGPPGSGKTTLATIIANLTKSKFITISAVSSGVKDLRAIIERAQTDKELHAQSTIVFVDEIHRWNKAQQDALLPYIEKGIITLIGATTENPSFELNSALLSRCQVFVFEKLAAEDMMNIISSAAPNISHDVAETIMNVADGDARVALNTIEMLQKTYPDLSSITKADVQDTLKKVALRYDKSGDEHYNLISALHKTMRAGDANAAVYWCGRMLSSGEDPLYVMRRVVEFAAEDIGNADPQALPLCVAAYQSAHFLGMPEGKYGIYQAVAYCAQAKKSRAVYDAAQAIEQDIAETPNDSVPMHLRNAPTKLMRELGYGKKDKGESNLPEHLAGREYL